MKKLLMAVAALLFSTGVAAAGQLLTDRQMDGVTAGFSSLSNADAEGLVGESGVVLTTTATLSEVAAFATARLGETSSTLYKSVAAAQSSTVTSSFNPAVIPGL